METVKSLSILPCTGDMQAPTLYSTTTNTKESDPAAAQSVLVNSPPPYTAALVHIPQASFPSIHTSPKPPVGFLSSTNALTVTLCLLAPADNPEECTLGSEEEKVASDTHQGEWSSSSLGHACQTPSSIHSSLVHISQSSLSDSSAAPIR
ncbi:hypothetical protein P7K49_013082 [Saguinus oedipus]|uniref:Uncharacterized protein n=1 Tax=Saguinus oedipus TaxID=9490 RepID=A0ABQ9VHT0_SAGOE|nr:hypothetical protein P7K49_013082 [Saguinus oedipus]